MLLENSWKKAWTNHDAKLITFKFQQGGGRMGGGGGLASHVWELTVIRPSPHSPSPHSPSTHSPSPHSSWHGQSLHYQGSSSVLSSTTVSVGPLVLIASCCVPVGSCAPEKDSRSPEDHAISRCRFTVFLFSLPAQFSCQSFTSKLCASSLS